jgi:tRNA pseudouridine38-40 synthase
MVQLFDSEMDGICMKKIKLVLQYDGTDYCGWQVQPDRITIQGLMEESLKEITREEVRIVSAGRTDAGVHALEQIAVFATSSSLKPTVFLKALNSMLPGDIRILDAEYVDRNFYPRYSAKSKRYFYLIENSGGRNPFLIRYSHYIQVRLDVESMQMAAASLIGRHDFSSFRGSGCGAKTTVREIFSLDVLQISDVDFLTMSFSGPFIKIAVEANAFLRYMVRNIVGTLVEVGRGKVRPEDVEGIMKKKDRQYAGPTVPAKGLFLERVFL